MSKAQPTGLVTKVEALQMVTKQIDHAPCVDVDTLMKLFEWQQKLCYLVIKECTANNTPIKERHL